jgi:hypothetical protein
MLDPFKKNGKKKSKKRRKKENPKFLRRTPLVNDEI